jgi:hypothetical protein
VIRRPDILTLATDTAAWDSLEGPLSVHELQRLSFLQAKIEALVLLADNHQPLQIRFAKHLVYARYLVQSGRLRESIP